MGQTKGTHRLLNLATTLAVPESRRGIAAQGPLRTPIEHSQIGRVGRSEMIGIDRVLDLMLPIGGH